MSGQVWFYLAPDVRYGITFLLISSMDYIYVRYELTKCVCQVSWWVYLVYFLISGMTLPVFYVRYEFTCIFMSGMSLPGFFCQVCMVWVYLYSLSGMVLPYSTLLRCCSRPLPACSGGLQWGTGCPGHPAGHLSRPVSAQRNQSWNLQNHIG